MIAQCQRQADAERRGVSRRPAVGPSRTCARPTSWTTTCATCGSAEVRRSSEASDDILKVLEERGRAQPAAGQQASVSVPPETERYSLYPRHHGRARSKDWSQAGFELECARAIAIAQSTRHRTTATRSMCRSRCMQRPRGKAGPSATVTVGHGAGAGGYLVETEQHVASSSCCATARWRSAWARRRLSGLHGQRDGADAQSAAATAYWLANEGDADHRERSRRSAQLAPCRRKTVGAYTELSRQLLLQSNPGAEGDGERTTWRSRWPAWRWTSRRSWKASGAGGAPTGISATGGIGSVTGGLAGRGLA
ncbi:MAG: hypothetical protein MZW92_31815 [Comamonadaceae bacterium]|nr:hypothetical protein [Comamonadaceae bacterium]